MFTGYNPNHENADVIQVESLHPEMSFVDTKNTCHATHFCQFPRHLKKNHTNEKEHAKPLQISLANCCVFAAVSCGNGAKCSFR